MDAVDTAVGPMSPNYRRVFSITDSTGTWMPIGDAKPFIGEIDSISVEPEHRLDFVVDDDALVTALRAIESSHPYEEPAVDVIPMRHWRSYLE